MPSSPTPDGSKKNAKARSAKPWIIGGSCVVALAAAYFGGAAYVSSQIPANAQVAGIDIGSMSQDEARSVLTEKVLPLVKKPVEVTVLGEPYELDPVAAGVEFDVDQTVDDVTGYELNPSELISRITGDYIVTPALNIDEDKLTAQLTELAKKADADAVEGTITFKDGEAKLSEPKTGVKVDVPAATDFLKNTWPLDGSTREIPAMELTPEISAEDLDSFYGSTVKDLLDGEVTLASGKKKASISTASIAAAASYKPKDGAPALNLDDEKLYEAATKNSDLSSTAKNAKIVLKDGKPSIQKSVKGVSLDTKGLGAKVLAATKTKERVAEVEMTETDAEFTTADAKKLGIKEEIVDFSTPYPTYDTVRTKNLKAGAARVNGLIIKPGERFSLLEALGPITTANGYYSSGVVENGLSAEAVGGGLSQISTQMYNVGFLAGYDDITHKPHSRWFDRYPAGREATLWEGQIDMVWENNTPYGVMIQAWVSSDRVHTRLWSTKYWKVTSDNSGHYNLTNPTTVHNDAKQCIAESGGQKGFSIDVTRYRETFDGSKKLPAETKSWTYSPWNKIVCDNK